MNIDKIIEEIDSKSIVDKYIYILNLLDNLDFSNKEETRKVFTIFNNEKIIKYAKYCQQINSMFDDFNYTFDDFIQQKKNNFDSELNFYYLLIAELTSLNHFQKLFRDIDNNTAIIKLNKLIRKTKLKMLNYT